MISGDLFHKAKSVNVLSKAMLLTAHFHIFYFNWIKYSIAVGLLLFIYSIYLFIYFYYFFTAVALQWDSFVDSIPVRAFSFGR